MNGRVSKYVTIEDGFIRIDGEQTLSEGGKIVPIFLFAEFTKEGTQTVNQAASFRIIFGQLDMEEDSEEIEVGEDSDEQDSDDENTEQENE